MAFRPDPKQPELPLDPKQRMDAVRLVRLRSVEMYRTGHDSKAVSRRGVPNHKALLVLLDHHIGRNESWELSYDQIAEEMEVDLSSVYRFAADLERVCLIRRHPGSGGRTRFSICWANLFELFDEQAEIRATTKTVRGSTNRVRSTTTDFRATTKSIRGSTNAPLIPQIIPPPPPPFATSSAAVAAVVEEIDRESPQDAPPEAEGPEVDEAIVAVQSCGATDAGPAVALALAQGWTVQQIIETAEYFALMRPAWDAGALVKRLKRIGSHLQPIDEGWPPRSKASAAARPQLSPYATPDEREVAILGHEDRHGHALDAMTEVEVRQLISESPRFKSDRARRDALTGRLRKGDEYRAVLLLALDDRLMGKVPPRGTSPPIASSSCQNVEPAAP